MDLRKLGFGRWEITVFPIVTSHLDYPLGSLGLLLEANKQA